ncbi:MAG: PLDc N-terminal domain-containing protein, partial [Aeromicrobium sp.]
MEDFSFWDLFVSIFWFTLLLAWITLLIHILGDLFRDNELSGGVKALWTLFVVLLPWLGTLCYLIVRGGSMNERYRQASQERDAQMRAYVQDAAGGS